MNPNGIAWVRVSSRATGKILGDGSKPLPARITPKRVTAGGYVYHRETGFLASRNNWRSGYRLRLLAYQVNGQAATVIGS